MGRDRKVVDDERIIVKLEKQSPILSNSTKLV